MIQPSMRFIAVLLALATVLSLMVPAAYAAPAASGAMASGCEQPYDHEGCASVCQPAPLLPQGLERLPGNPLGAWADGGIRTAATEAIRAPTWSPVGVTALGPPAYLNFRHLLL
jgi:hypothetical protein